MWKLTLETSRLLYHNTYTLPIAYWSITRQSDKLQLCFSADMSDLCILYQEQTLEGILNVNVN